MRESRRLSTKAVTDAGVFAALSIVLFLIAQFVPVIGLFVSFVWAVPLMIVVLRHPLWTGILCGVVIVGGAMVLTGPFIGLFTGFALVGIGLAYGLCFKYRVSPARTLFCGTVISGFATAAALLFMGLLGNLPFAAILDQVKVSLEEWLQMYASMGLLGDVLPGGLTEEAYIAELLKVFQLLLPAVFILGAMSTAAANYFAAVFILRRFHFSIPALPPFREWHIPWWMVWGVIVALVALFAGNRWQIPWLMSLAQNLIYIYTPITVLAGISLLSFLFRQYRIPRGVQVLIWVLAVLFLTFSFPFVAFFGLLDMVVDYRKMYAGLKKGKDKNDK